MNAHGGDRSIRIVLADDDERFRVLVRGILEDDGYTVVAEAGDANEALAMARAHQPDVVVLDLVMDGADGLSALQALLADDPHRHVVVISSLFDPAIEYQVVGLGAGYVEKAEGLEALERAIDAILVRPEPD